MSTLQQVTDPPQDHVAVPINDNFSALEHVAVYGMNAETTTALTWGYLGGRWNGFPITAGTLTLTASVANYVVVAKATGVASVSTATTNWNDGTNYARVYKVTAGAATVDPANIEDHRVGTSAVLGGGAASAGGSGFEYTASSTTTDADPGTGILRWNNATQASATTLYIDNAEADGASVASLWAILPTASYLKIVKADDPETWQLWNLTAPPVNGTGYYKFTVSLLAQEGSNIANGVSILLNVDTSASVSTFAGGTLTSALNEAPTVTIASATTPAIFAAAGNTISMTGTNTVTGFDTIAAGAIRRVTFTGALQLTHNATSMQNVTSANITTVAGDVAEFLSLGSGNTKMLSYQRKDGSALSVAGIADGDKGDITVSSGGTTWVIDNDVVTYAKMQDVSATARVLARKTAGPGDPEEATLSEILDFVGSAARGDILYRNATVWTRLAGGTLGQALRTQSTSADPVWVFPLQVIPIACSDETTALTAGTSKVTFINPFDTAINVVAVKASLTTAQTSGSIFTVDINEAGTSIISTKLTIDNTEKNTSTAATPAVISDASIAANAECSVDIDQIGDGTAKGLKVYIVFWVALP